MTREEFIQILNEKGYSYEIVGDKISVVTKESWHVNLGSLKTIPPNVEFNNEGSVNLKSLETLPPGVEFNNLVDVNLKSLETIPPGFKFNNKGDVKLKSFWFEDWNGNIEGIYSKRLLNGMIKRGLFL